MSTREIKIPDLGDVEGVSVVEILVAVGDRVEKDDGLVTLESDKASMDVPSPAAGRVEEIRVEEGAEVAEGDVIALLEVEEASDASDAAGEDDDDASEADGETSPDAADEDGDTEEEAVEGRASESGASDRATDDSSEREPRQEGGTSREAAAPVDLPAADVTCQVLVLGSGPGGYTAAFRAADLGQRVVLVERHATLGGVCLNVGCIPSKALLHVARVIEEAADLADHGVDFGEPEIDLAKLRGFKDGVVSRLTKGLAAMADKREVEIVRGTGRFTGPHLLTVEAEDGETTVAFEKAIVAAGSRVIEIAGIPWDDPRVMSSTGALELADVPDKLLLVGGGIIGLEMAMVYGSLGSELTIVEMLDGLIPGCDRDLVKPLERRLKRRFEATIHLQTKVASIEATDDGLLATFEGEKAPDEPQRFDRALVAVGRRPNGDRIGAEAAGIEVDEGGFVSVDKEQRTSVPHIFAIGDITGQPMLAHKASHEGKVAAEVAAGEKSAFDARVIPSVAYTDPEIAWVGLTETEAADEGTAYELASFPWSASGRSLGMGRSDGLTRILFDPETHRVLGGGIVGPNAGDLISELALAIEMGCEAADLALTIHPHPTLSETVAFAAEAYEGTITDLYLPKKS
ncbi:MAG: dihydrolipoyl dehydrogenase [Thermoanaerobaculia bacterium]|nr:dihydrolipoyl dehydrogenase [Thermoanaerobaculia bacterium]